MEFVEWTSTGAADPAPFNLTSAANAFDMDGNYVLTAFFKVSYTEPKSYYITATAEPGATITPSGVVVVSGGSNQAFMFSVQEEYVITAVLVDGRPISQAELDSGSYTFRYVNANHAIHVTVRDARTDITLRIDVMQGSGYATYSVNGGEFVRYTAVVTLRDDDSVTVVAHATDGSEFVQWRDSGRIFTEEVMTLPHITGSVYLELYFTDDGNDSNIWWWLLVVVSLLVFALFSFFFLVWMRTGLFVTVMMDGKAVSGVSVTFRVDSGNKTKSGVKSTNSKGKCWISARKDSVVTIITAAKEGNTAVNLPATVAMESRREYFDLLFK
jgi:hypothetical protein